LDELFLLGGEPAKAVPDKTTTFWLRFYNYVTPVSRAAEAARTLAGTTDGLPGKQDVSEANIASHMRRMRKRGRPFPVTAWRAARGIRALKASRWCAGPLFLFAAGYYGLFAKLLIDVDDRAISRERRRLLSQSALQAVTVETRAERIRAIEESSHSEARKKVLLQWTRDISPDETADRITWRLDPLKEEPAFESLLSRLIPTYPPGSPSSHLNGAYPPVNLISDANSDVVVCAMAEDAHIPLAMRQRIVTTTLNRALSATT